ncbi:hypothetical protein KIM67_02415 [Flagellimonas sp. 389]|uniref:hypothetical protein n=1 Tax=Flagellimonas sp. 389 TaxID=2835862 RepID=UPI001BD33AE5|nr:hypothetical protein [Flagellimonas sp. 389]MBS9461249.1 hypothetical protein [Flagellimonas sp. 389]
MMDRGKTNVELEYELRLTKKILERIIALNKNIVTPDEKELDKIEEMLKLELEKEYPTYKIQKKR